MPAPRYFLSASYFLQTNRTLRLLLHFWLNFSLFVDPRRWRANSAGTNQSSWLEWGLHCSYFWTAPNEKQSKSRHQEYCPNDNKKRGHLRQRVRRRWLALEVLEENSDEVWVAVFVEQEPHAHYNLGCVKSEVLGLVMLKDLNVVLWDHSESLHVNNCALH